MDEYNKILEKYLPEQSVDLIFEWINNYKIHLRISRNRRSKLGDFRAAYNGLPHRISINNNLNKYSFLITLVHEIAHLVVFEKHGNRVKPHGKEWKITYRNLMNPFLLDHVFPDNLSNIIYQFMKNASASSNTNLLLARALKEFETEGEPGMPIEDLEENSIFKISNGKVFKKLEKRRKRFKCLNLENSKYYLFDPLTRVHLLEEDVA
ncbi:MAG: sprT domain-containing protein [Bacteroidetes bacterium]|nr:sprT domain-containing protein [Bacteroidota bacterium]